MNTYVQQSKAFVSYLAICNTTQARALIKLSSDSEIKAVCEIALNYINNTFKPVSDFSRRYNLLQNLACRDISLDRKRSILIRSTCYMTVIQKLIKEFLQL